MVKGGQQLEVGKMYPFYRHAEKETKSSFEGWGKLLEVTEPKETFLYLGDLWQLYRVKVEFTSEVPKGCERGRLNDPFVSKPFITHKSKRVIIIPNASDKEIVEYSYTPPPRKAKLGEAYYQNLSDNYESNCIFTELDVSENLLERGERRKTSTSQLPYCREPKSTYGRQGVWSYSAKRER